jgi:hypothetical protein
MKQEYILRYDEDSIWSTIDVWIATWLIWYIWESCKRRFPSQIFWDDLGTIARYFITLRPEIMERETTKVRVHFAELIKCY